MRSPHSKLHNPRLAELDTPNISKAQAPSQVLKPKQRLPETLPHVRFCELSREFQWYKTNLLPIHQINERSMKASPWKQPPRPHKLPPIYTKCWHQENIPTILQGNQHCIGVKSTRASWVTPIVQPIHKSNNMNQQWGKTHECLISHPHSFVVWVATILYCKRTILAILKSILGSQLLTLTLISSSDLSWMREIQPLVLNGTKVWLWNDSWDPVETFHPDVHELPLISSELTYDLALTLIKL
jgi:hypothetical protein